VTTLADLKGRPWPKRPQNQCSACGEDFAAVSAFERHRVGKHDRDFSPEYPEGRRCLSLEELIERGFNLNQHGRWQAPMKDGAAPVDWARIRAER
jgi:hypothetical protein